MVCHIKGRAYAKESREQYFYQQGGQQQTRNEELYGIILLEYYDVDKLKRMINAWGF